MISAAAWGQAPGAGVSVAPTPSQMPAAKVDEAKAAEGAQTLAARAGEEFPWNPRIATAEQVLSQVPRRLPEIPVKVWESVQVDPVRLRMASSALGAVSQIKIPKKYDIRLIGDRGVGGGMNFYSLEKEVNIGREMAQDVEANAKLFQDEQINEYVNRLAQNLVRNSDAKVQFTVKIVDNEEVNAFALPGGFFYINVGMLMAAENEAELAGVMAHEIAHVAARHATKNATKKDLWSLMSIPLVFVGGPAGMIAQNVANIAVPMSFLKFSRNAEREADLLGLEYQYAAGYDPAAMIAFFERVGGKEKKQNFLARAFSTHPMNQDRVKRSQKTMQTLLPPAEEYLVSTSEFDEMKARLAQLTRGNGLKIKGAGAEDEERPTLKRKDGK